MARTVDTNDSTAHAHDELETIEDLVKDFLLENPSFILDDADILVSLTAPTINAGNNVIDLQTIMIERLQRKVRQLREIQTELIDAASINALTRDRVFAAVLNLMEAKSFEDLIAYITKPDGLAAALELDTVALAIESRADAPGLGVRGLRILEAGGTDRAIGSGNNVRLTAHIEPNPGLYGSSAGHVHSEALVRLTFSRTTPPGVLALGSTHAEQFHPTQAADLLEFLGRVIERAVRQWLDLPRTL